MKFLIPLMLLFTVSAVKAEKVITLKEANTIAFNDVVRSQFIAEKSAELLEKDLALAKGEPIYLIMDTPGGSVTDGLLFITLAKSLGRPIHTVTIFAASMGYQIVQQMGDRYILPNGTLMSHRGAISGLSGQVPGELNSRLGYFQELLQRMDKLASARLNVSLKDYQSSIINELWTTGENAVSSNNADEVVLVRCSVELASGRYEKQFQTIFGPITAIFSKCPLISSAISAKFDNGVKTQESPYKVLDQYKRRVILSF